tara:strand:- start:9 stop:485 length:477 start_codon:yes stop_codon:yes gene_type:complete
MLYKLKENLPTIEILLGYFFYVFLIVEFSLSAGIIWMIFVVYLWLFTSMSLQKYKFQSLINLIGASGIIISITLFFTLGVEEVPYPEGALVFHIKGITQALILFFISSVPLLLLNKKNINNNSPPFKNKKHQNQQKYDSDLWEEASLEDVSSGKYETI